MSDQAAVLRATYAAATVIEPTLHGPETFVLGSGKGGVGKSLLTALLASAYARRGHRTLVVDGAQNQGNQHILFGVRPTHSLESLVRGETTPSDLLVPLAEGLDLVPADSGAEALYGLTSVDRARLHQRVCGLFGEYDAVFIDGGPGLESVVRAAGIQASRLVVLTAPEPAALSDAYALLKIIHLQVPSLPSDVMVNRAMADEEGQAVFARLQLAARRFLRRELGYLGAVLEDDALRRCARQPGAVLGVVSEEVEGIAERLGTGERLETPDEGTGDDAGTRGQHP